MAIFLVTIVFLAFISLQAIAFWLFFDRTLGDNEIVLTSKKADK
jgi:hypothetical protein